eukprot:CAMPEP_0198205296 /NCGR_PEP_ID=MMETSP1445-20131203/8819_1 /TAXON_ID=36898 /ORGANISM="Pyramimonas sp., Strain CCMP2087" /LENGTH=313 /DNA_ID=CAMNT_0043877553 /DNA_START=477 /DNA_END=1418 /DNA_ORIENTATION=+
MYDATPSARVLAEVVALATPFKPKGRLINEGKLTLALGGASRSPKLLMELMPDPVKKGKPKVTSHHQTPNPIADYAHKCAEDKRLKGLMANNNKGDKANRPWAAGWSTRAQEPGHPLAPQPRIRFPPKLDGASLHAHDQATRAESGSGCSSSQDIGSRTKWLLHHGPDAKRVQPFPLPLARVPEEHRTKQDENRRKQAEYTHERDSYLRQYKAQQKSKQEEAKIDDEETRKRLKTIKQAQAGMIKSELRLRRIASGRATIKQGQEREIKQFRCPSTGVFWKDPPELKPRMKVSKEGDSEDGAATDMLDMTEMV